ncbi:MAG: ATP-binding protein [Saprospiraceae bacterium]
MKIKTKITLGVGLLFMLIILLGLVGAIYINALKADTKNILVANYNTLDYARKMLVELDLSNEKSQEIFEENLVAQEHTITEIGELEVTQQLRAFFNTFKSNPSDSLLKPRMRKEIFKLMEMNMHAIQRKSERAQETAEIATFWIAATATLCFLIAFTLLINLPSNIADPINELTNSIKQIADKKYSERVHFETHNEYGDLARSFNIMAEKLQEYNNSNLSKLMMEKKRIETLINNMHDPVLGLDEHLNVIFVNEEATQIIGLKQPDLIGKPAKELALQNDLIRALVQDIGQPAQDAKTHKINPIKIYADGKESYFEKQNLQISITPTAEKDNIVIGHVIILRNITEYKELDFAKTNFIATLSHEFKTPIASIKLSLQLLENEQIGTLNAEQKHLVEGIQEDATRLLNITGELINISQVESGNMQLSIRPAAPLEMLQYAINATKVPAEQKKIKFELNYPENLPEILADHEKTSWVLTNLIANAIQYSHENATIYLTIIPQNDQLQFFVKDTGTGIAPQYKNKIFDRYFRAPGAKKEGTGLGLAISKAFIEAQGGSIAVESAIGVGSTFIVSMPTLP